MECVMLSVNNVSEKARVRKKEKRKEKMAKKVFFFLSI